MASSSQFVRWQDTLLSLVKLRGRGDTAIERCLRMAAYASGYRSSWIHHHRDIHHALIGAGRGDLPPMLMLHGFASCAAHCLPLLQLLRPMVRQLIAPDLPLHGCSVVNTKDVDIRKMQADLISTVPQWIDEPAVVLGSSLGGLAAIRLALNKPQCVRALVLVSPAGAPMCEAEYDSLMQLVGVKTLKHSLKFVDSVFARRHFLRLFMAMGLWHRIRDPDLQQCINSIRHEFFLSIEEVQSLQMPILLIWGEQERVLPASGFDFFAKYLPSSSTLVKEPDFSHGTFIDSPWRVMCHVMRFMYNL